MDKPQVNKIPMKGKWIFLRVLAINFILIIREIIRNQRLRWIFSCITMTIPFAIQSIFIHRFYIHLYLGRGYIDQPGWGSCIFATGFCIFPIILAPVKNKINKVLFGLWISLGTFLLMMPWSFINAIMHGDAP